MTATLRVFLYGSVDGLDPRPVVNLLRDDPAIQALAPGASVAFAVAGFGTDLRFYTARELSAYPSVLSSLRRRDRRTVGLVITRTEAW